MNRVFVSSTCYDLLDLRTEVEAQLKEMGLVPVLSDRPSSEFEVTGYKDSIATCLANVEGSDVFVCILSQRYGPKLGKLGYDDVSATHLEYNAAKLAGLPIYLYARDRLVGESDTWRRNKPKPSKATKLGGLAKKRSAGKPEPIKFAWVPKDNEGIFDFLEEHRTLAKGSPDTNWFGEFRDSPELKLLIARDLHLRSRPALLRRLIEQGRAPAIGIRSTGTNRQPNHMVVTLVFSCAGRTAALRPSVSIMSPAGTWTDSAALGSDITDAQTPGRNVQIPLPSQAAASTVHLRLSYETEFGQAIEDTFAITLWQPVRVEARCTERKLVGDVPYLLG